MTDVSPDSPPATRERTAPCLIDALHERRVPPGMTLAEAAFGDSRAHHAPRRGDGSEASDVMKRHLVDLRTRLDLRDQGSPPRPLHEVPGP